VKEGTGSRGCVITLAPSPYSDQSAGRLVRGTDRGFYFEDPFGFVIDVRERVAGHFSGEPTGPDFIP
jgi:hypothetical protein